MDKLPTPPQPLTLDYLRQHGVPFRHLAELPDIPVVAVAGPTHMVSTDELADYIGCTAQEVWEAVQPHVEAGTLDHWTEFGITLLITKLPDT